MKVSKHPFSFFLNQLNSQIFYLSKSLNKLTSLSPHIEWDTSFEVTVMDSVVLDQVNHLVLCKQHLAGKSGTASIVQIVRDIGGLHATSATTPYLSLFSRMRNFKKEALDEELYLKKNLGKIRCIRKTVFILSKDVIPVAFAATNRIVEPVSEKY